MEKIRIYLVCVLVFAVISATSLVLTFMALTDIYHGFEIDVTLEWLMVKVFFVFFGLFTLLTIFTVIKLFRSGLMGNRIKGRG